MAKRTKRRRLGAGPPRESWKRRAARFLLKKKPSRFAIEQSVSAKGEHKICVVDKTGQRATSCSTGLSPKDALKKAVAGIK